MQSSNILNPFYFNMKTIFFILISLFLMKSHAQNYFEEFFAFSNFEDFKIISEDRNRWVFFHTENQDFNKNGIIDNWEDFKLTRIVQESPTSSYIEFYLKRVDDSLIRSKGNIDGQKIDIDQFIAHANRNEIATWDNPKKTAYRPNETYNFEFEIMIPEDFQFEKSNCQDPDNLNSDLTGQWHFSHDVLKGATMPPISLRVACDEWKLNLNPMNKKDANYRFVSLGKIEKGKWTKWKFQLRLSHKKRGIIRIWKDDVEVFTQNKQRNIAGKRMGDKIPTYYMKIGVYKPHWWSRTTHTQERRILYRNVKVYK